MNNKRSNMFKKTSNAIGAWEKKLFQFHKPPPTRRRRRKKSNKWIDRAKKEASMMPSLDNLEENLLVKAAILCSAGHYSFYYTDFKWDSAEDAFFVQNMIWAIEVLEKKYPRYLQYARWVAIKQAIDLIEGKHKIYQKKQNMDHYFTVPEEVPPPDMEGLMQEEWERHISRYRRPVHVSQRKDMLSNLLRELNKIQESAARQSNQAPNKPSDKIPVDIDGKGTIVMMNPDEQAVWNMIIKQLSPDQPPIEKNGSSP
jgi:hypothetical protein